MSEHEDLMWLSNPIYDLCKDCSRSVRNWDFADTKYSYELLKWEELQLEKRNKPIKRELEWATVAREIALLNMPYTRQ